MFIVIVVFSFIPVRMTYVVPSSRMNSNFSLNTSQIAFTFLFCSQNVCQNVASLSCPSDTLQNCVGTA